MTSVVRLRLLAWLPVVAWAGLIFLASAQSDLRFIPDEGLDFVVRKIGHAGVFGLLALLLWRALAMTTTVRHAWAWALLGAVLYAISDELHQSFTSGRNGAWTDVAIDAAGSLLAVLLVRTVLARRARTGPPRGR